jgi:hypothetical protein
MLPNFLVIGAQKAGSTFALNCLAEHPDIYMPQDEIKFFEDPAYQPSQLSDLENLFQHLTDKKVVGIKRPGYLGRPECTARIYHHLPQAKLIAILRDPVSRAVSAYYHAMKCGYLPIVPVEVGLTRILDGKYQTRYPLAQEVIDFGFYYRHLMRYLDYFERSQLLVLLFDTIKSDPLPAIKRLYHFVGVDESYVSQALQQRDQQNPGVYSLPRIRFRAIRNPILYRYYHNHTRRDRRPQTLLNRLVEKVVLTIDERVLSPIFGNEKPQLSPAVKRRLYDIYAEDIERLEELLGQPLPTWKKYAQPQPLPLADQK